MADIAQIKSSLAHESVWIEKYKYDDGERIYYEKLAKGQSPDDNQQAKGNKKQNEKSKRQNQNDKGTTGVKDKPQSKQHSQHSNQILSQNTLISDDIARVREKIKLSLASNSINAGDRKEQNSEEVSSRLHKLEKENQNLKSTVSSLQQLVKKLESRISALELSGKSSSQSTGKKEEPKKEPKKETKNEPETKKKVEDDDDDIDLFGSDEDTEAEELKKKRLEEYEAKKAKKPGVIAKSSIVLDVKPWDDETNMNDMEKQVRAIEMDGLLWGASKFVPLAYGIRKLQIVCVIEDDKVSVDELTERIEGIEDLVQSVDIAAFNKI